MLTEVGRIVGIEDDGLWVETIRRSTCGSCAAQKGCGHGLLNKLSDGKRGYIRILPGREKLADYRLDDRVLFSIPEGVILRASLLAYVLPLVLMLVGAATVAQLAPQWQDAGAVLGAAGGLVSGFALLRWQSERHRRDQGFQPVLLGRAPPVSEPVTLV